MNRIIPACLLAVSLACPAIAQTFRVSVDTTPTDPAVPALTPRLVISLVAEGSSVEDVNPLSGPFWSDPQPMLGWDLREISEGDVLEVSFGAGDGFVSSMRDIDVLPAGNYRAAAFVILGRESSDWKTDAGNLFSEVVEFTHPSENPIELSLSEQSDTMRQALLERAERAGVEEFKIRSPSLSAFHGRDVFLKAGVAPPLDRDPDRAYPAVYQVPGFGGRHIQGAIRFASSIRSRQTPPPGTSDLASEAFWIVLDPESPNGHTLFCDSINNGPVGHALTTELIPALEKEYNLIPDPDARLLRGHSSGGWTVVHLLMEYPNVFGHAFSSAPDPLSFEAFQIPDIYAMNGNFYFDEEGEPFVSYKRDGQALMTILQENLFEEVMGPGNTAGQQWDSWFAVFGPQAASGAPAALFDPSTGAIDEDIASYYRRADITERLRRDPERLTPILLDRLWLAMGEEDNFSLEQGAHIFHDELIAQAEALGIDPNDMDGEIIFVEGADHGSVLGASETRDVRVKMLERLKSREMVEKD